MRCNRQRAALPAWQFAAGYSGTVAVAGIRHWSYYGHVLCDRSILKLFQEAGKDCLFLHVLGDLRRRYYSPLLSFGAQALSFMLAMAHYALTQVGARLDVVPDLSIALCSANDLDC